MTYINAGWEAFRGELQLEIEPIFCRLKPPFSAERLLILEE
jgi:hypothetical protein